MSGLLLLSEIHPLAHINAALNATATVLLVLGFLLIISLIVAGVVGLKLFDAA